MAGARPWGGRLGDFNFETPGLYGMQVEEASAPGSPPGSGWRFRVSTAAGSLSFPSKRARTHPSGNRAGLF